jgi:hypothetical protein
MVVGDSGPVITSLVKVATGLDTVHAESYVKQADEIFTADSSTKTSGISHPENFIRAKAIMHWKENTTTANDAIIPIIEGTINIDQLDIFRQRELSAFTKQFLQLYLKPKWFRSPLVTGLAKQYFADFHWDENALLIPALIEQLAASHPSVKDYLGYVLLDFMLADPSLEEVPAGWAIQFAEDAQLKETFDAIVKKELKLSDKKLQQYKKKMLDAYHNVKEGLDEQVYE